MKTRLLLSILLATTQSFAQDVCKITNHHEPQEIIPLAHEPNYFFKASPDGKFIYYISKLGNHVLDTQKKQTKLIPGTADPVPSHDGEVLTFLFKDKADTIGFRVGAVTMSPAWNSPVSTTKDWATTIPGSYQSIGPLVNGKRSFFYQNDQTSDLTLLDLKVNPTTKNVTLDNPQVIQGITPKLRLPMMSPDGKFFSALDVRANQTVIYSLNGNIATLVDRLPIGAGKATFSYDSKKMTFHLAKKMHPDMEIWYPAKPVADFSVRNIYVYNLSSKKITPVTNHKDDDSYFPVFLKDDRIAYVTKRNSKFTIDISKVPQTETMAFKDVENCTPNSDAKFLIEQLGKEWAKLCGKWQSNAMEDGGVDLSVGLTLPKSFCLETAKKKNDVNLEKFCLQLDKQTTALNTPEAPKNAVVPKGKVIFQMKCMICHQDDESKLANSQRLHGLLTGQLKPQMPVGGSKLSDIEITDLETYLQGFKSGAR